MVSKIVVFVAVLALVAGKTYLGEQQEKALTEELGYGDEQWFEQKLDHFNPQNKETWKQRYFDNSKYWDPETGPLFLYIGGEGTLREPADNSLIVNMAKKFNGRVFALEHRFYGKSQPLEDWSLDSLQYLSPD